VAVLILGVSCGQRTQEKNAFTMTGPIAPDVNSQYGWLNTDRSYSLKDFRGKIVLLDFWTLGCINCQHIIPDIERLQRKFSKS
jgi:thiol-disulfide isomerase/thioredoxin